MKKDTNLDDLFREKLRNYELNPPVGLLENVQAGVEGVRKRRKLFYWRVSAVAAALLLAFVAGWQFNSRNDRATGLPALVNRETVSGKAAQTISQPEGKPAAALADANSITAVNSSAAVQNAFTKNNPTSGSPVAKSILTATPETKLASTDGPELLKPLKSLYRFLEQTKAENELQETKAEEARAERFEQTIDQQIMDQNQKKFLAENTIRERGRWLVGAQATPAYSVDRSSHSRVYASNMINSSSVNPVDLAGGISVEYKTGKRLSVQSGIYYSGIGQSSGNSSGRQRDNLAYANPGSGYFNTPVNIDAATNKVMMNSSAGVIELNGVPPSIVLGTSLADHSLVSNAVMLSDVQFIQNFEYLEIPVYLRYTLIDARFGLEMLGGFSSNFLIGNETYLQNSTGRSLVGSTQDMQTLNYSGTFGVGLRYRLSKHVFLNVEPRVKYFLNSLNSNSSVNYKPYTFGIYSGVSYEF